MPSDNVSRLSSPAAAGIALCALLNATNVSAQDAMPTPREAAPIDMTGYWVAVVTEDWRFRMVVPPAGDYDSVPLTAEGRRVADTWDPARDAANGQACRWYGAGSIMSVPTRLRIAWEDEDTLRLDADAGMQTRAFEFAAKPNADLEASWQGFSQVEWRTRTGGMEPGSEPGGSLEVRTSHMRPGYLRRNGVPYSDDAQLTEWFYVLEDGPTTWLIVVTEVRDPRYLNQPFVTSRQFKKQSDDAGWNPTPCSAGLGPV
jgi:hypothetical protein